MTNDEAEKLASKWFVDNRIGFDGARLVKLVSFIREIENAAFLRAADEPYVVLGECRNARKIRDRIRNLIIQPPAQKENRE